MRRLYLQIYLTIVVILVIATLAIGLMGRFAFDEARFDDMITVAGELAVNALPPPDAPRARQQEAIERLHDMLRIDLALYSPRGERLAAAGRPTSAGRISAALLRPRERIAGPGWFR